MKKVLVAILLLLIVGAGYVAFGKYQHKRFIEALVPHVKNASLRVANSARYETEESSRITYKELFEKFESDISEVDKRLIDIQSLSSPKTSQVTDPTVTYLKASQEYLRALLQKNRKQLAVSIAVNWANKSLDELRASSSYGFDFAMHSSDNAIKSVGDAEREYNASIPELVASVTKLKESREGVRNLFPEDALIPVSQLNAVIQKNLSEPKTAASQAK